jgi:ubiquinone/menaquinone biosynthesis C-methylase UbiE
MDSASATLKQAKSRSPKKSETAAPPIRLVTPGQKPEIPAYLQEVYYWAYLNPRNVRWLNHEPVVRLILWNQHVKLRNSAFAEIEPGQNVLQSTCVYGQYLPLLAERIGESGHLSLVDVAEVQLTNAYRRLHKYPHVSLHHANVMELSDKQFDVAISYFLLHEIPDDDKKKAINVLLNKVKPGGKLVFIDYDKPHWWHPLKPITSIVFDTLEPFAKGLWRHEIRDFAEDSDRFEWRKENFFGKLFQKVVATRL